MRKSKKDQLQLKNKKTMGLQIILIELMRNNKGETREHVIFEACMSSRGLI
jgi:hypothetical protein